MAAERPHHGARGRVRPEVAACCRLWKACSLKQLQILLLCRYLPHAGIATIIMNDYPIAKYALIGMLGLFVLTSKDPS